MDILQVNIDNITLLKRDNHIIKKAKFNLESNKIYSIYGSNGSGKTTLLLSFTNLLNKNLFSITGEVIVDSKNIFSLSEEMLQKLRKNYFQYVFQNPSASFDALKCLNYYFDFVQDKNLLIELLTESMMPKLKELSKKHIYELSEGQAQRLMICIAMANNPKLLILDEPTASLDILNINIIKSLLKKFVNQSNSVLVVTHDKSFANDISTESAKLFDGVLSPFSSIIET